MEKIMKFKAIAQEMADTYEAKSWKMRKRRTWTEQERNLVERLYPDHSNQYIADMVHRSKAAIDRFAVIHKLRKNAAFAEEQKKKHQFKKGSKPFNKGVPMKYWMSPEGMKNVVSTRWKGRHDKHIGYESIDKDGYVYIKTEKSKRMVLKHRWIWKQAHGPIPKGYVCIFKDGNPLNCSLENLMVISRAEHLKKNRSSISPERMDEINRKIQDARKRHIKSERARICFGLEPKGKLVKHYKPKKRKAIWQKSK